MNYSWVYFMDKIKVPIDMLSTHIHSRGSTVRIERLVILIIHTHREIIKFKF